MESSSLNMHSLLSRFGLASNILPYYNNNYMKWEFILRCLCKSTKMCLDHNYEAFLNIYRMIPKPKSKLQELLCITFPNQVIQFDHNFELILDLSQTRWNDFFRKAAYKLADIGVIKSIKILMDSRFDLCKLLSSGPFLRMKIYYHPVMFLLKNLCELNINLKLGESLNFLIYLYFWVK